MPKLLEFRRVLFRSNAMVPYPGRATSQATGRRYGARFRPVSASRCQAFLTGQRTLAVSFVRLTNIHRQATTNCSFDGSSGVHSAPSSEFTDTNQRLRCGTTV